MAGYSGVLWGPPTQSWEATSDRAGSTWLVPPGSRYRMRAWNGSAHVYWWAPTPDSSGAYYTGGGTLSDVVVTFTRW